MKHSILLLAIWVSTMVQASPSIVLSKDTTLMGVSFSFSAVHHDERMAQDAIDRGIEEVVRIEKLISSWDQASQTSEVNRNAGVKPVVVDKELYQLIERSCRISTLTDGHFDISFASIHKIWDFEHFQQSKLPSDESIGQSIAMIDYEKIKLNPEDQSVFLSEKGMKIGFGAIGKGYAANRVKHVMQELGIQSGVINAGGDLLSWGQKPDGEPWSIGIADPQDGNNIISWLDISDMAVVTSGNYKKYVTIDGKRYCHIINPKTGWPVENLSSVTIICADAEIADALATSVFVLGKEDGLKLINHLNGVECMIIDENQQMSFSDNLNKNFIAHQ